MAKTINFPDSPPNYDRIAQELNIPGLELAWWSVDALSRLRLRIGELAVQAIDAGRLSGRLALEAYQYHGPARLWHGSAWSPGELDPSRYRSNKPYPVLRPQQAYWLDGEGRKYAHGQPAICVAETYDFPLLRSLLHRRYVGNSFGNIVLTERIDGDGRQYHFTSQAYLSRLLADDTHGYVYALRREPNDREYWEPHIPADGEQSAEYRIHHSVTPAVSVETIYSDLPPMLMVIDGDGDQARAFLKGLPDVPLMDHIDAYKERVRVKPLGGHFPLELHPFV